MPTPDDNFSAEEYGAWWAALVEYSGLLIWKRECQAQNPVLLQVPPEIHSKHRKELEDLLEKKRVLEADTIRVRWREQQLQYRDRPRTKWFMLRSSKQNQALRLREAVKASISTGLLTMFPCWLVGPEAAAQAFPLESGLFDVVIFDEASQCPIEQAVPAIYRGKNLIVAGDAKQLPPTDFFSGRADDSSEEGTEDQEGAEATEQVVPPAEQSRQAIGKTFLLQVEDLLEAAVGNLPHRWLQVHYRSQHPDLIEFSNRAFYKGQLEVPPSTLATRGGQPPIAYRAVGGLYSERTNRKEAESVLDLLKSYWLEEGVAPTIGVVTFNRPQRDLIEDLIEESCQRDASFAVRYEQERMRRELNQDVGFFVKNLENVQGDERDVMIFSTTFGRDSSGRFYRRFGPVGQKDGERRLNVAVTRAKEKIWVISSIPIEEMSGPLSIGTGELVGITPQRYLQLYLAYAQAVSDGNLERRKYVLDLLRPQTRPVQQDGAPESPLEEEVRHALEKMGYTIHGQVNESGFRIDLCVLHPDSRCGYILGIECDGAKYHSDRSARLRDVWRQRILEKRGWQLHRVWSTRWWNNRAEEIEKLEGVLGDLAAQEFRRPHAQARRENPAENVVTQA